MTTMARLLRVAMMLTILGQSRVTNHLFTLGVRVDF